MTDKPVVLVAEDDPSVRMTLEFVLKYEGFQVLFAQDGEEALVVARESIPDLILLDKIMPKMDGREVLGALRQDGATSGIPVFVLSGMSSPDEAAEWEGAEFIGKPFSPDELVARIRTVLGGP